MYNCFEILHEVMGAYWSKYWQNQIFQKNFYYGEKGQKFLQNSIFLAFAKNTVHWCVFFTLK